MRARTDPRLCHSTRNGPKSTIQESGAGVCGVDERFTRFSIAFLDPKTGKETEVHACAEAGNPYAHATVKAAARLEVLRRFGHAHRVVAGAFKDSDELLAKKKQVDRDWRYVMDTLNKHGDTYPQIHEIFELIADEERAALLCHAKHHGSNRGAPSSPRRGDPKVVCAVWRRLVVVGRARVACSRFVY